MRQATRGRTRVPGAVDDQPSGISPGSLANLQLWFDAMTIKNLADGAAVSQWNDLSGNNRHLAQATGGNQPIWKEKGLNGLPCVRFDGSNDYMTCTAFAHTNLTMFGVVFPTDWISNDICVFSLFAAGSEDWNSADGWAFSTGVGDYQFNWLRYVGANAMSMSVSPAWYNPMIVTLRLDNSGATAYVHINGGADTSDTYSDTTQIDAASMRIGARGTTLNNYSRIDYAEIIAYSDLLSSANIAAIEAYLTAKWRIG
jgi:hypothetical protein